MHKNDETPRSLLKKYAMVSHLEMLKLRPELRSLAWQPFSPIATLHLTFKSKYTWLHEKTNSQHKSLPIHLRPFRTLLSLSAPI